MIQKQDYIVQSEASARAVRYYLDGDPLIPLNARALDLCAAPGGKSIYLKELRSDLNITSCDIHPHRVELIKKYADGVGAKLTILQNDASVLKSEFVNAFDLVVCDVPCSGVGVAAGKPDILLFKSADDIKALTDLQYRILDTAANYVVSGGALCYSTCTVFKDENERITERFLSAHPEFLTAENGPLNLFPHIDNTDGFFACKMYKKAV